MTMKELALKNRSIRHFVQSESVTRKTLEALVDIARLSPSGQNLQPLKYFLSHTPEINAQIFKHLGWAKNIPGWNGPKEGERPAAYILVLGDRRIRPEFGCDHGIAAQSIKLGLTEMGLGGCILGSIEREDLAIELGVADHFEILLAIAIGKPAETVQLECVEEGKTGYWRDADGVHHVPKRSLEESIVNQSIRVDSNNIEYNSVKF